MAAILPQHVLNIIANILRAAIQIVGIRSKPLLAINQNFCEIWMLFGYVILRFLLLNKLSYTHIRIVAS